MWQKRQSARDAGRSPVDHRTPYERDRTRLIHSAAFRRLQRKTQILGTHEGDFHRTRLTHSLEVDSIARSLAHNLAQKLLTQPLFSALLPHLPNDDLISTIALSHDIGHSPFGHGGEAALNQLMLPYGGFESNGQTLRLLTKLEDSYAPFGLDLTRRTLLGILKYPASYSMLINPKNTRTPPKCYLDNEQPEINWIFEALSQADKQLFQSTIITDQYHKKTCYHSLDCSLMNLADDIAYGIHDLEDAIYLKLIFREQFNADLLKHLFKAAFPHGTILLQDANALLNALFHAQAAQRKQAISDLVNGLITSVTIAITHPDFQEPLLHYNAILPEPMLALLDYFKDIVFQHVIDSPEARIAEYGGQTIIRQLFNAIASHPEGLLDLTSREKFHHANTDNARMRVICDTIACMTDEYARNMHKKLYHL